MYIDAYGKSWWVAKDICDILALNNVTRALKEIPDSEKGSITLSKGTPGGNPTMLTVNEHGLYRLIFKSRKAETEAFKLWVFDVIENIRKTGSYALPIREEPLSLLSDA